MKKYTLSEDNNLIIVMFHIKKLNENIVVYSFADALVRALYVHLNKTMIS